MDASGGVCAIFIVKNPPQAFIATVWNGVVFGLGKVIGVSAGSDAFYGCLRNQTLPVELALIQHELPDTAKVS